MSPGGLRVLAFLILALPGVQACSLSAPTVGDYARSRSAAGGASAAGQGGAASVGGQSEAGGMPPDAGSGAQPDAGDAGASGVAPCIAQAETCNGVDDDCDGAVDNGCPSALLAGSAVTEPIRGDSKGGSSFSDTCASDELVVGLQIAIHGYLDQTTTLCQKFSLKVDKRARPYAYSVTGGATEHLVSRPTSSDSALTELTCAAGAFVVGMHVYQQYLAVPNYPGPELTGISILCAEPSIDLTLTEPALDWSTAVEVGPLYGTDYTSADAMLKTDLLDMGRFAVGTRGSAGSWIDTVGLISSPVQVLLQ